LIGLVCIACGVTSRIIWMQFSYPRGKLDYAYEGFFQIICYAPGFLLLLIDLELSARRSQLPEQKRWQRRWLWFAVACAGMFAVMSSCCGGW
jgi:hypothetical protein